MRSFVWKIILPVIIVSGFLLLYIHNLSHSVYSGDVGDLVTAAAVGGVAHPPGYALFTFLGFLLVHQTLIHATPAFLVGLISAVSAALGLVCFYEVSFLLSKDKTTSFLATCILGFSFLYWFYAEIAEVFMLNTLLALGLFLVAIFYQRKGKALFLYVFFFLLGLSITHHPTIFLIYTSLFLLIIPTAFRQIRKSPLVILNSFFFLLLGLTPFLYIFIASAHSPLLNWDNVQSLQSFFHLFLRQDYGTFQAGLFQSISPIQRLVTLQIFFQYILVQLTIPVVLFSCVGFWELFRKNKVIFLPLLLAFLLTGPVFLVYAGFPLTSSFILGTYERFILLPEVLLLIPLALGIRTSILWLTRFLPKRRYDMLFTLAFFLIPFMLFFYNFPKTDLSNFNLGETYVKDFFNPLPQHAILLVSGDTETFNSWYVHYVLHLRPDVNLYNLTGIQIKGNLIASLLKDVPQSKQNDYLTSLIPNLQKAYPVFSQIKIQPKKGQKFIWMPVGLNYQLMSKESLPPKDEYKKQTLAVWSTLHVPTPLDLQKKVYHNLSIAEIPSHYADMLVSAGAFAYSTYGDSDTALLLYKKAKEIDPTDPRAYADEAVVYMSTAGKCSQTAQDLSKAISLDPYTQPPYFILYTVLQSCYKNNPTMLSGLVKEYTTLFQRDFMKDYKKSGVNTSLYE